jgi:hypothetical protein
MAELVFSHPRIDVYHGCWQAVGLAPQSVDVVLTDPPYTNHVHQNVRSCNTTGAVKVTTYDIPFAALSGYEHVPAQLALAKRWVLNFCALEQLGDYCEAAGGHRKQAEGETAAEYRARAAAYVRSGIWRKQQAAPQLTGDRPAGSCEGFALMHQKGGKLRWAGGGKHAYLSSNEEDTDKPFSVPDFIDEGREKAKKRHPAQKPWALCQRLAAWFVEPGDVVLDGYAGSGNLGFAALAAGARKIILCDIDPEWAVFLAERAHEVVAKLPDCAKL